MLFRRQGGIEWLVVFLGNPGRQYENTRHNAGFLVADRVEKRLGVKIRRLRFRALTAEADIEGRRVLLMKPQTYMNLSGEAVQPAAAFYKLPPERVIVVSDEMSLPVGSVRVRPSGSAGGHNGLKSIIAALGSESFPRIRLGVGAPPHPDYDVKDWVLGGFQGKDAEAFGEAAELAAEAIESYVIDGAERTMSRYNKRSKAG